MLFLQNAGRFSQDFKTERIEGVERNQDKGGGCIGVVYVLLSFCFFFFLKIPEGLKEAKNSRPKSCAYDHTYMFPSYIIGTKKSPWPKAGVVLFGARGLPFTRPARKLPVRLRKDWLGYQVRMDCHTCHMGCSLNQGRRD